MESGEGLIHCNTRQCIYTAATETLSFDYGDTCPDPQHVVPFDTTTNDVVIMQGWDGEWSHKEGFPTENDHLRFAVDFALPYGTVVNASRRGIVQLLYVGSDRYVENDDPNPPPDLVRTAPANVAYIQAEDGTYDVYSHLEQWSGLVKEGDTVDVHQPIARTGRSGWVGNVPHLHFHVMKELGKRMCIPFGLKDFPHSLWHGDQA